MQTGDILSETEAQHIDDLEYIAQEYLLCLESTGYNPTSEARRILGIPEVTE